MGDQTFTLNIKEQSLLIFILISRVVPRKKTNKHYTFQISKTYSQLNVRSICKRLMTDAN